MSYENVKNFRTRLKERAVYVMGGKCQCCGYDKCIQALEFHHINPNEKEFSFGDNTNRSWKDTREELQKCILLCANCHREAHFGMIEENKLISSFSEDRALEIDSLIEEVKSYNTCKMCGAKIGASSECCNKCAHIKARVAERPNREELKKLIRSIPFTQIGKQFGVTDNSIRKWCKSMNLPSKSSDIKSYTDEEWQNI